MKRIKKWLAKYWLWVIFGVVIVAFAWSEVRQGEQQAQINDSVVQFESNSHRIHNLTVKNRALVTSLQAAVVESCEQNGNARAKVQRAQLHEEIKEAKHPDPQAFHALVKAGIAPRVIRESEAKVVVKLQRRLGRVKLVPCEKQYHISPGSGADRRRGQK